MISSITISPKKSSAKESLVILDEKALIELGYFKLSLNEEEVKEAMLTKESMDEINEYVIVEVSNEELPARIKVNAKRNSTNTQADELLDIVEAA